MAWVFPLNAGSTGVVRARDCVEQLPDAVIVSTRHTAWLISPGRYRPWAGRCRPRVGRRPPFAQPRRLACGLVDRCRGRRLRVEIGKGDDPDRQGFECLAHRCGTAAAGSPFA